MFKLPKFLRRKDIKPVKPTLLELYKLSQKLYEDYDLFLLYYTNLPTEERTTITEQFEMFLTRSEFNLFNTRAELQIAVTEHMKETYIKNLQETKDGSVIKG